MEVEIPFIPFNIVIQRQEEVRWLAWILDCVTPGELDNIGCKEADKVVSFRKRLVEKINERRG